MGAYPCLSFITKVDGTVSSGYAVEYFSD